MGLPSFTKKYHHVPYAGIDPTRPELSAKGKIVVVTGGGTGIGAGTALSFAKANAKAVVLIGRRAELLNATKASIEEQYPSTTVATYALDITNEEGVKTCFSDVRTQLGLVDVCIHGAAYLSDRGAVADSPLSDFWKAFEVTVKGGFIVAQQFLRNAAQNDAVLVGINSIISHLPASSVDQCPASYGSSKIALAKLYEHIASEYRNIRCYSIHPGVIETEMALKSDAMAPPREAGDNPFGPRDDVLLPGHFCVWLASPSGAVVPSGRFLWSNWDVDELKERSEELHKDPMALVMTIPGWPFPQPTG